MVNLKIVDLQEATVVSSRAWGTSPEVAAWEALRAWAEPRGLLADCQQHPVYGFNNPAPSEGSQEYGYEFWIVVDNADQLPGNLECKKFEGGRYAAMKCRFADGTDLPAKWMQLWEWVDASEYTWRETHELEHHLNPASSLEELELELLLPIKDS